MINFFRSKVHAAKDRAQRKREAERRLRKEMALSRTQAMHATKIVVQELEG